MAEQPVPPDFSQWSLSLKASFWYDTTESKIYVLPADSEDTKSALWVGHINSYNDKTGLATGCEYDIFGRGVLVKFWGLEKDDSDRFSSAAVFNEGKWHYFNLADYRVVVAVAKADDDPADIHFSAALVFVRDSDTEENIIKLVIPK